MKIMDRYIAKNVLFSVFLVLTIIVFLQTIFVFIGQLNSVRENYQLLQVIRYSLSTMPGTFYEVIPIASLIGCLAGLGSMASSNELVIIRAAGISLWRVGYSLMKPALVIICVGFVVGEYIVPPIEQNAEIQRKLARSPDGKYADEGVWHREGNDFIFFNSIGSDGVLYGISRYHFDDNNLLLEASYAERGDRKSNGWLLQKVKGTRFEAGSTNSYSVNSEKWDIQLDPDFLRILVSRPNHLPLSGLFMYISYLSGQELDSGEYSLAFWKKLLMPLSVFSLVIIGMSFVFGPLRSVSFGFRLFSGVTIGVVFMISQNLMGAISLVFGFAPALAVLLPIMCCFLLGGYLLQRVA